MSEPLQCDHTQCVDEAEYPVRFGDGTRRQYCESHTEDLLGVEYLQVELL